MANLKLNNLRQISVLIYRLKRNFGLPIIIRRTTRVHNLETGVVTPTNTDYEISRAIMPPKKEMLTFLSLMGGNFNYGGYFDATEREVNLDAKDISVVPTSEDSVIFQNRQYAIVSVIEAESTMAYLMKIKETARGAAIT